MPIYNKVNGVWRTVNNVWYQNYWNWRYTPLVYDKNSGVWKKVFSSVELYPELGYQVTNDGGGSIDPDGLLRGGEISDGNIGYIQVAPTSPQYGLIFSLRIYPGIIMKPGDRVDYEWKCDLTNGNDSKAISIAALGVNFVRDTSVVVSWKNNADYCWKRQAGTFIVGPKEGSEIPYIFAYIESGYNPYIQTIYIYSLKVNGQTIKINWR